MNRVDRSKFIEKIREGVAKSGKNYMRELCKTLRTFNNKYDWVGVYVLKGDTLVLHSYSGEKTEHERISLGDGLCSQAIVLNAIVNEPDVKANSEYLACFVNTNSELVVPVRYDGIAVGEIDIDSDTRGAFTKEDESFISEIASEISNVVRSISLS
ncbi:MAG: GAF domain-containing protein [Thermoplasmataceae archaeon]